MINPLVGEESWKRRRINVQHPKTVSEADNRLTSHIQYSAQDLSNAQSEACGYCLLTCSPGSVKTMHKGKINEHNM